MDSAVPQFGDSHHAIEPPAIESGCSGVACDVNTMLAVVVVLGALALGAVALIGTVRRARQACQYEHERLVEEYEAFAAFADRVADIQVAPRPDGGRQLQTPSGPAAMGAPAASSGSTSGLQAVRTAYRETVMDVPHFETDYDESLERHMAAELSPELASAVSKGADLTPALREPLVASARAAARDRRVLAEDVADEIDDVESAEETLRSVSRRFERTDGGLVERTFPDLQARWRRLDSLESECSRVLERRQAQLRDRTPDSSTRLQSPTAVSEYLYGGMEVDFPVLATGTKIVERLRDEKHATVEALTERRR